jgi:hypothetical protein
MQNIHQLNQLKLKYLRINGYLEICDIIPNLPDTIESFIIMNGWSITPLLLNQLNTFPHLNYLKINLTCSIFETILHIDTIHFIIYRHSKPVHKIDIPNVKNIIIANKDVRCGIKKLCLTSVNAITCQLINIQISDLSVTLPNCPKIKTDTK